MATFVCVGLDIKRIGFAEPYSADANVWNQEVELYERAKRELSIEENVFQLLHPKNLGESSLLLEMVKSSTHAVLVSFEIPERVFEAFPYRDLISPPIGSVMTDQGWEALGLDICDIDGFFSFLDMTYSTDKSASLFHEDNLVDALILAQAANLEIPDHAPFVVVRLKMHTGLI